MTDGTEQYGFTRAFELAVLRHLVLEPRVWGQVGGSIEPDALGSEEAKLLAKAVAAIAAETGRGPGSGTLVVQRVARWRHEGRVTHEQVMAVSDLVDELEDWENPPPVDGVVHELVPVLQERRNREAVRMAMKRVATRDDLTDVIEHLQATSRLGTTQAVTGVELGPDALAVVRNLRQTDRLRTGILELDTELGGGPPISSLSVAMGGSGDGKSMLLCHMAGSALMGGFNVLVATLELNDGQWLARLMANLTGIPIDTIIEGSMERDCAHRLGDLPLGRCEVGHWAPEVTRVADLMEWVDQVEQRKGWKADLLVVDYADLLGHSKMRDYEGMREVYSGLREEFAVKRHGWVWTACQSRRKAKGGKEKQGADDGADSQHKIRVSDLWIVLRMSEDGSEIEYYVAKNRGGKRGGSVTLPTELECARIAPIAELTSDDLPDLF
jgi:hypothetical protein